MSARSWFVGAGVGLLAASLLLASAGAAPAAEEGRGFGRMGPAHARTTTVSPSAGPDFEMPFRCGQTWTGSTRSSHSPSTWTIDFNRPGDLGEMVVASAPGVVTKAVSLRTSYGRYVVVDHGGFSTLYAHLRNITTSVGTWLDQGDLIGRLGTSGNSTGPHLHFEERKAGAYFRPWFHRTPHRFGSPASSMNCNDRPVSGDWDGDGRFEVGTYRGAPSRSIFVLRLRSGEYRRIPWGQASDAPLTGDWNGNGKTQLGHRRLGTTTFSRRTTRGTASNIRYVGSAIDTPVTGDWDGNSRTDVGAYRASDSTFLLRAADGRVTEVPWGDYGDRAVTGDWNNDGRTEIGTFDPRTATWTLRVKRRYKHATRVLTFGTPGDLPVTGDWNGDGVTDLGTWTPATATFHLRTPTRDGYQVTDIVSGNRRR